MIRRKLLIRQMNIKHLILLVQIQTTQQIQPMSITFLSGIENIIDEVLLIIYTSCHVGWLVEIVDRTKVFVVS